MKAIFIEVFGWYGMVAILAAYMCSSFQLLLPNHPLVLFLNITGSVGFILVSFSKKAYQPAVLNCIWVLISLITLFRTFFL